MSEQKLIQKYIIVRMWTRLDGPKWVGSLHSINSQDDKTLYIQTDGSFLATPCIFNSLTPLLQTISTSWKGICIRPYGDRFLVDKPGTSLYLDQNGNECDGLAPMSLEEAIKMTRKYLSPKSKESVECPEQSTIRTFATGATRDTSTGKLSYVKALSPIVLQRYVQYLDKHRLQPDGNMREFDNWKKGIPQETYLDSRVRHEISTWLLMDGFPAEDNHGPIDLEDSLCAIIFNAMGQLHELLKERSTKERN